MPTDLPVINADGYFGQRGVNSYVADEVEPSFRRMVFEMEPNGAMQVTGMTSMFPKETEHNAEFSWWEKRFPARHGACTVYTTEGMSTQYAAGTATDKNTIVYIKCAAALAAHMRKRHVVKLQQKYSFAVEPTGEVMDVVANGDNSRIVVRVFHATATGVLNGINYLHVITNVNPDGSYVPEGTGVQKIKRSNHLQTFRNPIKMTRRAMKQNMRTGDPMAEARRDSSMLMGLDLEQAMLFGEMDDGTIMVDDEPQTSMEGIVPTIRRLAPNNIVDFRNSTDDRFVGKSWAEAGEEFLDEYLRHIFHYGPKEKSVVCGSGFLQGINRTAKQMSQITVATGFTSMGTNVTSWISPHGTLHFKDHPLFTDDPTYSWAGLVLVPSYLRQVVSEEMNTRVLSEEDKKKKAGIDGYDGALEEWFAELSLRMNGVEAFWLLGGIGCDHKDYVAA